ncbi:BrnT family toxin [Duganella sp. CF458]|uniref:BrnT family toxin n=1 Tax=Duganella sp. CF458 TaxID=1884368 RepID=UPI001479913F
MENFQWFGIHFRDDRFPYPERRYNTIGFVDERIAKLTYCYESENLRVISFRKATTREARQYYFVLRERDGLGRN